jgi:hypothetical protein
MNASEFALSAKSALTRVRKLFGQRKSSRAFDADLRGYTRIEPRKRHLLYPRESVLIRVEESLYTTKNQVE